MTMWKMNTPPIAEAYGITQLIMAVVEFDYKLRLYFDGSVTFDKEEWLVHYSEQPKSAPIITIFL